MLCQIQRHFHELISWNLWVVQWIHYLHNIRHRKAQCPVCRWIAPRSLSDFSVLMPAICWNNDLFITKSQLSHGDKCISKSHIFKTTLVTKDRNNAFHTKPSDIKKAPIRSKPFRMHVDRRNNCIFDTRIFSPLLARPSKHRALIGYCFCVDNQISDGLARQGLSVLFSKDWENTRLWEVTERYLEEYSLWHNLRQTNRIQTKCLSKI